MKFETYILIVLTNHVCLTDLSPEFALMAIKLGRINLGKINFKRPGVSQTRMPWSLRVLRAADVSLFNGDTSGVFSVFIRPFKN